MSRLLVFLAIFCAACATIIGFGWIDNAQHYEGWLAATLLAWLVAGEVDR